MSVRSLLTGNGASAATPSGGARDNSDGLLPDLSRLSTDNKRNYGDLSEEPANREVKHRTVLTWGPRKSPSERVCELPNTEPALTLLSILKEKMRANMLRPLKNVTCAPSWFAFPRSREKLAELLGDDANFERQHCMQLVGGEFHERLNMQKVKDLVRAYKGVWSDGQADTKWDGRWNLDDEVKDSVIGVVKEHMGLFLPMIHALVDAGYASPSNEFQLLYRFQSLRHNQAGVYHMDYNGYQTYADDGKILGEWTTAGSRAVVTSACINMSDDAPQPIEWHDCGTKVALGVPTLKPSALNELMVVVYDEASAEAPACNKKRILQNKVTHHLMEATEFALIEFEKGGHSMESAGISEITLENGVISDYNDTMFHKANMDVPPDYSRVFFVMGPRNRMAKQYVDIYDVEYERNCRVYVHPI
jgi:hypothetical protein